MFSCRQIFPKHKLNHSNNLPENGRKRRSGYIEKHGRLPKNCWNTDGLIPADFQHSMMSMSVDISFTLIKCLRLWQDRLKFGPPFLENEKPKLIPRKDSEKLIHVCILKNLLLHWKPWA